MLTPMLLSLQPPDSEGFASLSVTSSDQAGDVDWQGLLKTYRVKQSYLDWTPAASTAAPFAGVQGLLGALFLPRNPKKIGKKMRRIFRGTTAADLADENQGVDHILGEPLTVLPEGPVRAFFCTLTVREAEARGEERGGHPRSTKKFLLRIYMATELH